MKKIKNILVAALLSMSGSAGQAADLAAEWSGIKAPDMPALQKVTVDPKTSALLVMDFMKTSCTEQARPRCVASVAPVKKLLADARAKGMHIVYAVTGNDPVMTNFLPELAAQAGEPIVAARADKFLGTDLDKILKDKGVKTVIPVGTASNGAVLYTATGAAFRNYDVLLPIDGMSGNNAWSEQIVAWQLVNGPGLADRVKLTKTDMISF
jgi:nicotinamidase-related amidase